MKQDDIKILAVELPEDILKAKWCGDFERCERLIKVYLASDRTPEFVKQRLLVEREILARLPLDYGYDLEQAVKVVQEEIPDFTMEELESFMDQGKVDWIYINGQPHTATRFYETLVKVQPDIARRAGKIQESFNETASTKLREKAHAIMEEKGYVKAHIRLQAKIEIKPESFCEEEVLVHLPIPKPQKNMSNIRVLRTIPAMNEAEGVIVEIGSEDQPHRTVAFREIMKENHPFIVEYEYDSTAEYVDPSKVPAEKTKETFVQADLEEVYPHIRFTPTIRALYRELAGDETDPMKLARRFYDYVTTKVVYSFMRTYFTLEEIPEYAAMGQKGDCGVQALLFVTLCRLAGIPARWQSGLCVTPAFMDEPADCGMHDWAMFYTEEFGWCFTDCSYGGSAYRAGNELLWNHYFCNLDADRMAANDTYQAGLIPEKQYTRQDPYDSQAGEIEYKSHGLLWKDTIRERTLLDYQLID